MSSQTSSRKAGIAQIEVYVPKLYVDLQELGRPTLKAEIFDRVPPGKYTIGLGQKNMSSLPDFEDSVTMGLNGNHSLKKFSML
jgi:3-hydroxy-3-methylglutaryl CoA synthase